MDNWNSQIIFKLLQDSAKIAMQYYDSPDQEFKSDHSIVTIADKSIENFLAAHFDKPKENIYLIGEETINQHNADYAKNALKETAWIVDPIDGTAPYANHLPNWGVSIALMKNGKIIDGAIMLPVLNIILMTDGNNVLYSENITNETCFEDLKVLENRSQNFDKGKCVALSQRISKEGGINIKNPVQTLCSCVNSCANIALGYSSAYIATLKLWDIAGALAIFDRLNIKGQFLSGKKIDCKVNNTVYNLDFNSNDCWIYRDHIIFSDNYKTIDFLNKNLSI